MWKADIAPNFAGGYYGLALAHLWDGWLYLSRALPECWDLARPLAQRAVTLDDADATAHYRLTLIFSSSGDLDGWLTEAQRALTLGPNHAWALGILGAFYAFSGQLQEALAPPVIIPGGPPMHLTATGTEQRRALVLILHDSSMHATTPEHNWIPKGLCKT